MCNSQWEGNHSWLWETSLSLNTWRLRQEVCWESQAGLSYNRICLPTTGVETMQSDKDPSPASSSTETAGHTRIHAVIPVLWGPLY